MLKIPVSKLEGAQLDWAVAVLCEEYKTAHAMFPTMTLDPTFEGAFLCQQHGAIHCFLKPRNPMRQDPQRFSPSIDWSHGGPIIERERICLTCGAGFRSDAVWGFLWEAELGHVWVQGDTPLIAAMRAFVASKLGDEVEVPNGA